MDNIILFDGDCSFCNRNVRFIIKRDPKAIFKFASLQSDIGQTLLENYGVSKTENSLILLQNNRFYSKSTAALKICKELHLFWKWFYIFILIPRPIRDYVYSIISRNRYKWFKSAQKCTIPSSFNQNRFF